MRFVLDHVFVQFFPKRHESRPVEMPPGPRQLYHSDGPVGDVLLQVGLVPLEVVAGDLGENLHRTAVPRPALELPSLAHHKNSDNAVAWSTI